MRRYHAVDVLEQLYCLPNYFVRHVLNFLLSDFADSMYYTKRDVYRQPFLFATIGWFAIYFAFCMLSPLLLFFVDIDFNLNFITLSLLYGGVLWVFLLMVGIDIGIGFLKRLTKKILKYVKSVLGLHSEPETDDYNKSAKICRL